MLTTAKVDLPEQVTRRLQEKAAFSESWNAYTTEHLAGFRQPVATAVAVITPILIAFVYAASDLFSAVQVAANFGSVAVMFLLGAWYVNRRDIKASFERSTAARRLAKADLKAGHAEEAGLTLTTRPVFYEHEHGVIVLADSGDGRTLYFDVDGTGEDSRWFLYVNGDMHRGSWRWLKLLGSGSVTEFQAQGQRLAGIGDTPYVEAPDAWEAISLALGEPQDGDVIDMPFGEVKQTISRLL